MTMPQQTPGQADTTGPGTGGRRGFVPSPGCPHRACRPLHNAFTVLAVAFLVALAFHGLASLLFILAMAAIATAVLLAVWPAGVREDRRTPAPSAVRKGWARLAAGTDLLFLVAAVLDVVSMSADRSSVVPTPSAATYAGLAISLVLMVAMVGVRQLAHRRALAPADEHQH
jgi:hypothetical protein